MELQQLQALSLEEIKSYKEEATGRKAELEALKREGRKAWTPNLQEEFEDIVLFLTTIASVIAEKAAVDKGQVSTGYSVAPGTEKLVHVLIVRGRRFNSMTGKEESPAYTQMFTFAEWQLFKKAYKGLGYAIMAVLHDPYGDAAELVQK